METAVKLGEVKKDKLFNFRPLVFAAVSLIFGILFAYYYLLKGESARWLVLCLPVVGVPLFVCAKKERARRAFTLLILALFFMFGFISFRYQTYAYTDCKYFHGEYTVTGTVLSKTHSSGGYRLVLEDVYIDGERVEGRLDAYLPSTFNKETGIADIVVITGNVTTRTEFFGNYGFRANAIADEVRYSLNGSDFAIGGKSKNVFLLVRHRIERVLYAGMDETSAAVTLAMLTGDGSGIDNGLLSNMRQGGIAHIFAVSGLHVGALYAFCLLLFAKTKLQECSKPLRFTILALILLFYAALCGFSSSIVRATILCLTGYFMKQLGSSSDPLSTLSLAALLILIYAPVSLFEVGFQLSFLACLGIFLFARRIGQVCDKAYKRVRKRYPRSLTKAQEEILARGDTLPPSVEELFFRGIFSVFATSVAAFVATAPISYTAFGYLSGWSLILNLFLVPLISAVFALLLVVVAVACVLPISLAPYLLYIPALVWNVFLLVFEVVDFSSFSLRGMQVSGGLCVCYYGGLLFLTDKWNVSKRLAKTLATMCFVGFLLGLATLNLC